MTLKNWGPYMFLIGFAIAVFVGVLGQSLNAGALTWVYGILALFGLIIGLVNVSDKEAVPFLIAAIALTQLEAPLSRFSNIPVLQGTGVVEVLSTIIGAIVVFVVPAALVVALITIYKLAGEKAFEVVEQKVAPRRRR